jgi:hypothetical protein
MYFYFLFFKFVPRILFMRRITFGGDSDAGRAFVPQGKKGAATSTERYALCFLKRSLSLYYFFAVKTTKGSTKKKQYMAMKIDGSLFPRTQACINSKRLPVFCHPKMMIWPNRLERGPFLKHVK